jgi:hypothetical protein
MISVATQCAAIAGRRNLMFRRLLLGVIFAFTMTAESSASTDVGTFLSRCKSLQDITAGKRKASVLDEKNLFWCAGHVEGILDGYRIGVLIKGDMKFAKSVGVCPQRTPPMPGQFLWCSMSWRRKRSQSQRT